MTILAPTEVGDHVRAHGGRLYVWVVEHNKIALLSAATTPPPRAPGVFERYAADGYDLFLATGRRPAPDELELALAGHRRRSVKAFWNGRAYVTGARRA